MAFVDVLIVGGGMAGLACGRTLAQRGRSFQILEATDRVGGRVCTDRVDGFLLDRGFQVFLTAYPEAQAVFDYPALQLQEFEPGALIWLDGKLRRFADPWRRPQHLLATALSPVATLADKLRIAKFRRATTRGSLAELYERREQTTLALLQERGFSETILERFFRPFLGGVFLDEQLETSSRMAEFVFRMFSQGSAAVPAEGMGQLAAQLAGQLPSGSIRTDCEVADIEKGSVTLASGERLTARAVVVATAAPAARRLLQDPYPAAGQSVTCLYYGTSEPPLNEGILVLNGEGSASGPINNLCVPSAVSPAYAPAGQALVSVTVLGSCPDLAALERRVRAQLEAWFGAGTASWKHLKSYEIPYALPVQTPPALEPVEKRCQASEGIWLCGDHCDTASINGALAAGRRAGESVEAFLA